MIVGLIKPPAHLEAANKQTVSYQTGQGIFCTFFFRFNTYLIRPPQLLSPHNLNSMKFKLI